MKKLVVTLLFVVFGLSYAAAQHANVEKPLTQEQRMVQSNAKHKNGRNADVSKKVQRAKKQDRKARKMKSSNKKKPKR